jgi:putative ABC transport system permease protein
LIDGLYTAWQYICSNKIRTATLIACIVIISFLPVSLQLLLDESERQLMSRAVSTPLVVGAKGSSLDLIMNTLYFDDEVPDLITMEASDRILDTDMAIPIPVYIRFQARGFPIVGTTLDYFDFRGLKVAQGRQVAVLGDCVVGAKVAESFKIKPGDSLVSSPENLFDLAGVYPLKMKVVGVLDKVHTSDDLAVFVDLKTAWVIQGLGHGHEDVTKIKDQTLILKRSETNVAASAKLYHFQEITEKNIDSFHFHGNLAGYPITAVLVVPNDIKAGTILRGRYLSSEETHQVVKPEEVIDGLLQNIFRIKNVLDAVILVVGLATIMAIVMVFALSLRLRQREIETIFKLGCSRMTIARLIGSEILIVVSISCVVCTGAVFIVYQYANVLVRMLFIR